MGFWKITGKTVADFAQSLGSSCKVRGTWEEYGIFMQFMKRKVENLRESSGKRGIK